VATTQWTDTAHQHMRYATEFCSLRSSGRNDAAGRPQRIHYHLKGQACQACTAPWTPPYSSCKLSAASRRRLTARCTLSANSQPKPRCTACIQPTVRSSSSSSTQYGSPQCTVHSSSSTAPTVQTAHGWVLKQHGSLLTTSKER
jgi:hypothetical protein